MILKKDENFQKDVFLEKENFLKSKKKIKTLKFKIQKLKKEFLILKLNNKEYFEKLKLRLQKEIDIKYKFSLEKIIISLLPILDSLETALNIISKSKNNIKEVSKKISENNSFFLKVLSDNDVQVIQEVNVPFNPSIHQAMFLKNIKNFKKNYVIEILQKGYLLNNRLLRPAMVSVSS
jgi:molecular chaperone GrpE